MNEERFKLSLKQIIVSECQVKTLEAGLIENQESIIGSDSRLQLDSLDAVEIVTAVERHYGVRVDSPGAARKILKSIDSLAEFVKSQKPPTEIDSVAERILNARALDH